GERAVEGDPKNAVALPETPVVDLGVLLGDEPKQTLRAVILSLERAASDDRVHGVYLDIGRPQVGFAQLQELDAAMARFRESGKWSLAFLETAGELSRGDGAYAIATLADSITLAPSGDVNLIGLRTEPLFFRGTLDKLEVEAHFEKRGVYKSAANQYTASAMDKPTREALSELIDDLQSDLVELIARRRGVEPATVNEWIQTGPHNSQTALKFGMIDALGYSDEVTAVFEERVGREDPLVGVSTYWLEGRPFDSGELVAVVFGEGAVTRGNPAPGVLDDDPVMASDPLIRAFRTLREDGAKAVVFRVDSPGGSYLASDLIRREVELTRAAGIPVVISMGNVAASGGYFVSMD
ncbi:MAG: S49 family peptidase, partial [Myxococcota bacterium]